MTPVVPTSFAMPPALASQGYRLRPERDEDLPFLHRLYASTRQAELAPLLWTAEQKAGFLAQQFEAQRFHYRTFFAATAFDIVECDDVAIGRLYVDVRITHVHLIDIALMPQARGQGLGTALITALQDFARERDMGLALFVEAYNPALRLYRRLGFESVADHTIQIEMEWLPRSETPRGVQLNTA